MTTSLTRRLATRLLLGFAAATLLLLGLWAWVGQHAMRQEHERAALRLAGLFEASLHHAMLRRDLPGLSQLLQHLGGMPGMQGAALLNTAGEVRFASAGQRLGANEGKAIDGLCLTAGCGPIAEPQLRWSQGGAERALRVIYPVRNEARCLGCHGGVADRPVNGLLVLDFAPMAAERQAVQRASEWLLPAALAALLLLAASVAWVLRREVLRPLARLSAQVQRIGAGDWAARNALHGKDELAQLGQGVDAMADRVQQQIEALEGQRAFLQSVLDAAPDPMVLLDAATHRVVTVNAAYTRLLGTTLAEVQGQPCHRVSRGLAEPCAQTLVDCPLALCPGSTQPLRTVMTFVRKGGEAVDVEVHAAALRAVDGSLQVIEVLRPLADQVRFSQEQRLSAVGLLANGVAHEIHNPLASIRLALQSALRGLHDGSMPPHELAEYLRLVDQQIDRCVGITQRLMRLSQPSAHAVQPVAVRAAVDDVVTLLGEEVRQSQVSLSVDLPKDALRVLGDESELRQVLLNLLQNALHALQPGGSLGIEARRASGQVHITVSDNGSGIAPERMPLIFLPFFSHRADGHRGTGMGLAICKSLVEARGGRISVISQLGQGSRFTVELPDADA